MVDALTATLLVVGAAVVVLAARVWGDLLARRPIASPGGAAASKGAKDADPLDHERRLLVLEAKQRALELEWEDTRAKFLGMTRSFIRHAKAAGLDGAGNGEDTAPAGAAGHVAPSSRAAVLNAWRRKQGGLNAKS
jgi:hypothetical protein